MMMELGTEVVGTAESDECENCKIITDQYAYLKERLKKQSMTIDSLLANRKDSDGTPSQSSDRNNGPPNDLGQCHQIIQGMRQIIIDKDEEMKSLSKGAGYGRVVPIEFQNEMNALRESNARLQKRKKDLIEEKRYLERV